VLEPTEGAVMRRQPRQLVRPGLEVSGTIFHMSPAPASPTQAATTAAAPRDAMLVTPATSIGPVAVPESPMTPCSEKLVLRKGYAGLRKREMA
jgi:hypothetical protein